MGKIGDLPETLVSKRFSLTENSRLPTTLSTGCTETSLTSMLFPLSIFSDREGGSR